MVSPLCDLSVLKYQDEICVLNRRESMSDHQNRFIFRQPLKGKLYLMFVFCVCKCCSFIQHDNWRILQDRPRKRNPLILATGKISAARSNERVESIRKPIDNISALCIVDRSQNFFAASIRTSCFYVIQQCIFEQAGILKYESNPFHQFLFLNIAHVHTANSNGT